MSTTNDPDGTIPVTTAKEWAANWRDYLKTANPDFITRSFVIPIVDFKNILLYNPDAEAVKAFIGLEFAGDALSAKLMLVPVNGGEEVLYKHLTDEKVGNPPSNVYDLTTACPPTCGPGTGESLDA
ncbi:hypothetical protein [Mucilaginibacter phyllosphaerae]|uniref:Uncharacterized protein n=1 Tax=Mucilaginibacter phyllosphaerae TaxID=1812349 RepID=A0A4Y8AGM0_9SPHI|nr:hypothetical protein [Mucilaginibacter phyllosphaerae]MBB3968466.1 hypothetical protein [Mucilaginibacter phyllosphaerae]TEW67887.1 hypothetical protein E2R65_07835 [Mucilaginibacter phyllosphaerae]GGH15829.1 hypothetical protein GCM10007352_24840 [Mucilaginibacter phyllosphaerae]